MNWEDRQRKYMRTIDEDLQLIDELLCLVAANRPYDWERLETHGDHVAKKAMKRIKEAQESGEISQVTLSLSLHFEKQRKGSD